ncbi:MAG: calycin-like domain-containing protein [Bacteroidaceae bacterium]|nr:calycin-like domain-containing protein [Bacteroidaceae bacterium]
MKKLFTFLFVAATAMAGRATDYNVPITVIVNGVSSEQTAVITIVENNGLYDLTLKNFMLQSEDGPMGVGNVEMKGIKPCQDGNATLLLTNDTITITSGDDPSVPFWMSSMLPPVPVDLCAKIEGERLRCYIDIDLMESLGQVIQVAIGDGYQMPNASFEAWHTSTGSYVEPNGWHSFESATGSLAALAGHHIEKSSDAHSGEASARIFATSIFGIVANGTMTTGRMNAGSMSAADTQNHAYLDMSKTDLDGNGDPFYIPLCSRPDSVVAWVKFSQGKANASHPYATISAVITDGTFYQDPEDKEYTNVVAKAKDNKIATTGGQWVRVSAPFVYTDNAASPQAVLITISTNADAGQGSANDEVLVDDIAFIYNAKVSGISIEGVEVPGFSTGTTDYEMEMDKEITADDIEVLTDGKATNIAKTVTEKDGQYVCTIVAIGADMSAKSAYVVKVKNNLSTICDQLTASKQPVAYYTLDGRKAKTLVPGRIYICRQSDGSIAKIRQ